MQINKVIEIGASDWQGLYSKRFIDSGVETHLFEPNVIFYKSLVDKLWLKENIRIYNKAIYHHSDGVKFYNYGYSSYCYGFKCLGNTHMNLDNTIDDYDKLLEPLSTIVPTLDIKEFVKMIDENTYLSINCNGAEEIILTGLSKLPAVIRFVIYAHNNVQWSIANKNLQILNYLGYTNTTRKSNKLGTFFELEFAKR